MKEKCFIQAIKEVYFVETKESRQTYTFEYISGEN
jgi:hypothetical protein